MNADKSPADGLPKALSTPVAARLKRRMNVAGLMAGMVFLGNTVQAQTYYSEQRYATINESPLAGPAPSTSNQAGHSVAAQRPSERRTTKASTQSGPDDFAAPYAPVHVQQGQQPCWDAAARYQNVKGLNPWLLYAVAYVESRHNPAAIGRNNNGSYDLGLMQINSTWFPTLKKYGIQPQLLTNACASTFVGAWVLAQTIQRYGFTWQAIAAYNVGSVDTPRRRAIGYAYAKKVYAAYDLLTRRAGRVPGMGDPMRVLGMSEQTGRPTQAMTLASMDSIRQQTLETRAMAQAAPLIPGVTGSADDDRAVAPIKN
jgi:hypothetical protein